MRHRRGGYYQPLLDPLDEHARRLPLSASGGVADVDDDDPKRLRVAGFTRPLEHTSPTSYRGRHRKDDAT